jgi:hypothetical protein
MTFIIINRGRIASFLFQGVIYTIIILGLMQLMPSYHPDVFTAAMFLFFMSLNFMNFNVTYDKPTVDQYNLLDTYNPGIGKYSWELEDQKAKQ